MAEQKHTSEPWVACGAGECRCGMIWSEPADMQIVTCYGGIEREYVIAAVHREWGDSASAVYGSVTDEARSANATRIVSCVNACQGIADPSVIPELVHFLSRISDILSEQDFEEARSLLYRLKGTS
jgi:hypothetical protein